MTLSPTFLIYRTGFAPTNGTSVQMQRMFGSADESLVHLMWDQREAGDQSIRWVINTDDGDFGLYWKFPFIRLGRILRNLKESFFHPWWKSGQLNSSRLRKAMALVPLRPRQAYINFFNEADAARACELWKATGCPPFVLHILDIFDSELSETCTPNITFLARNANHVLCLNRLIEREMQRIGAVETSLFSLCSDLEPIPRGKSPSAPLKIIISGALYSNFNVENKAMNLLLEAWPQVARAFPGAELHYSGAASWGLPEELRPYIRDHGLLDTAAYRKLLRSCHMAYVPVSHLQHTTLRYSFPSRIPDYLVCGLPVIACTGENTGIHEFFQTTPHECTRLVSTAEDFLATVQEFANDSTDWEKASRAATDYAKEAFAVESARKILFNYLNAAGDLREIGMKN